MERNLKNSLKQIFERSRQAESNKILKSSNALVFVDTSYLVHLSMHSAYNAVKEEMQFEDDPNRDMTLDSDFRASLKNQLKTRIISASKAALQGCAPNLNNVVFAHDCPKSEIWRLKYYNEYKLQRRLADKSERPFDFAPVFRYVDEHLIPEFMDEFKGSKFIGVEGAEGDDIIASLVRIAPQDVEKVIISSDKDFLQLMKYPRVHVVTAVCKVYSLEEESKKVAKVFGEDNPMTPEQYLERKILMGDKSDNIKPIFDRCGEVTASILITEGGYKGMSLKEYLKNDDIKRHYRLNERLISFDMIPESIVESVKEQFFVDGGFSNVNPTISKSKPNLLDEVEDDEEVELLEKNKKEEEEDDDDWLT